MPEKDQHMKSNRWILVLESELVNFNAVEPKAAIRPVSNAIEPKATSIWFTNVTIE